MIFWKVILICMANKHVTCHSGKLYSISTVIIDMLLYHAMTQTRNAVKNALMPVNGGKLLPLTQS